MAKKKVSKFIPPKTKEVEVIPKDLQDQWGAAQCTSLAIGLFDQGMFSPRHLEHIPKVAAFLSALHTQTVESALKHPEAHMIPELKAELDKRAGKTNE